jgi:hypothetical protein
MILSLLFACMADACCKKKADAYYKTHGKHCCKKCAEGDDKKALKPTQAHLDESNHHTRSINNVKKFHHHKNKQQKNKSAKKSSIKKEKAKKTK